MSANSNSIDYNFAVVALDFSLLTFPCTFKLQMKQRNAIENEIFQIAEQETVGINNSFKINPRNPVKMYLECKEFVRLRTCWHTSVQVSY